MGRVEEWMLDAADTWIFNQTGIHGRKRIAVLRLAEVIASCAPQPSPDICEKCGQEVIDAHWSLVCHKPACIAALGETHGQS